MREHTVIKLRQLLEADDKLTKLRRDTNNIVGLKRYIAELARQKGPSEAVAELVGRYRILPRTTVQKSWRRKHARTQRGGRRSPRDPDRFEYEASVFLKIEHLVGHGRAERRYPITAKSSDVDWDALIEEAVNHHAHTMMHGPLERGTSIAGNETRARGDYHTARPLADFIDGKEVPIPPLSNRRRWPEAAPNTWIRY